MHPFLFISKNEPLTEKGSTALWKWTFVHIWLAKKKRKKICMTWRLWIVNFVPSLYIIQRRKFFFFVFLLLKWRTMLHNVEWIFWSVRKKAFLPDIVSPHCWFRWHNQICPSEIDDFLRLLFCLKITIFWEIKLVLFNLWAISFLSDSYL